MLVYLTIVELWDYSKHIFRTQISELVRFSFVLRYQTAILWDMVSKQLVLTELWLLSTLLSLLLSTKFSQTVLSPFLLLICDWLIDQLIVELALPSVWNSCCQTSFSTLQTKEATINVFPGYNPGQLLGCCLAWPVLNFLRSTFHSQRSLCHWNIFIVCLSHYTTNFYRTRFLFIWFPTFFSFSRTLSST